MDLKFLKSEELIQHIQVCTHLIDYPEEITPEKMECLILLFTQFYGFNIDDAPNKELIKRVKARPIPTIAEIEKELGEKCTNVRDYDFWVRKLFALWEHKLYSPYPYWPLIDETQQGNEKYLIGQMAFLNNMIQTLFDRLSKESGVPIPNLYRKDDIASIIESLNSANQELSNTDCTKEKYSEALLGLFHNHINLIEELTGKSDDEIASLIKKWSSQKDNFGKPLIENPSNGMRQKFAKELKQNGLIKLSEESFRKKL